MLWCWARPALPGCFCTTVAVFPASILAATPSPFRPNYDNANFGTGNAFDRRANIETSGVGDRIVAAGNANQGVSGTGVSNGATTTPTLVLGNVHVGANSFALNIDNTGSSGPALRGAIQTSVNGANLSDARLLSGSGVTERATGDRWRQAHRSVATWC